MRNYELMRNILLAVVHAEKELQVRDFAQYGELNGIKEELERLKEEGLIKHNIVWDSYGITLGTITGATPKGKGFARNIENLRVWSIVSKTLEAASLDLSYPLLKEVCDEIIRRYVMGKIPKDL